VFPAHASASGLVLLAALSRDELRQRYPEERLISHEPPAIARRSLLERELLLVWSRKYALVVDTTAPGVSAVAVPVENAHGITVAAVTIIAPTSRLPAEKLRACVVPLQKAVALMRPAFN
jgi:DNA-binding IclR family transcriptional regulator